MDRRHFLQLLVAGSAAATLPAATAALPAPPRRIELQRSPVAGFQYHEGEALWPILSVGSPLRLTREPDNPHDRRAVAVRFMGRRTGYIPRVENTAISQLLDCGATLRAHIATLARDHDPWRRVGVVVELEV